MTHPAETRPRDYWSPFRPALAEGFRGLCAYSAIYEPIGTVDHFVSISEDRSLAYAWDNYRFCSGWINQSKSKLPSDCLLDPYDVGLGWFEILLPSLQLRVSDEAPSEIRERAEFMIRKLHLRDDERAIRVRRSWLELYELGDLTLDGLRVRAPLIAAAVAKARGVGWLTVRDLGGGGGRTARLQTGVAVQRTARRAGVRSRVVLPAMLRMTERLRNED